MSTMEQMEANFKQVGIPYHDLRVFGAIKINVHVLCIGSSTAAKWVDILAAVFPNTKVKCVKTVWDAKENRGTCLLPTKVKGFLIAVAA